MIIYSEITGDIYPSVDDCIDAELAFRAEEKRLEAEKEAREKELQKAYDEAIAACDRYLKLADIAIDEDKVAEDDIKAEDVVKEVEIEFTDEDMETLIREIFDLIIGQVTILTNINKNKLLQLKIRLHRLYTNGKNDESPGVIRKVERQIRQIEHLGEINQSLLFNLE